MLVQDENPEVSAFPTPPRCLGSPLRDGEYTRCAYGDGALRPMTGPRDCPVCSGSGYEDFIAT
jgi:hypothetical protein